MGYDSNNYTITTLSSSIRQDNFLEGAVVSPFFLGTRGVGTLRKTCVPYSLAEGSYEPKITSSFQFPIQWEREACGTVDFDSRLPIIASTSAIYTPTIAVGGVTSSVALIASSSRTYTPVDLIPGGVTSSVALIASSSRTYTPDSVSIASSTEFYTQIVSASNPGNSTSMHVGSLYLDAQTYTTFGALFTDIKGGIGGSNAHVELKRFTNATSLLTLTNTSTAGATFRYVTSSNVIVPASDWYDIYISASGNPATSSIKGVYYEI